MDIVSEMEEQDYAGSYIESAVKSWLRHNRIKLSACIKINGAEDTPTLTNEQSPTREQLSRVLTRAYDSA